MLLHKLGYTRILHRQTGYVIEMNNCSCKSWIIYFHNLQALFLLIVFIEHCPLCYVSFFSCLLLTLLVVYCEHYYYVLCHLDSISFVYVFCLQYCYLPLFLLSLSFLPFLFVSFSFLLFTTPWLTCFWEVTLGLINKAFKFTPYLQFDCCVCPETLTRQAAYSSRAHWGSFPLGGHHRCRDRPKVGS